MINKKSKKMIRSSILNLLFHIHHSFSLLGGAQMRDVCVVGGGGDALLIKLTLMKTPWRVEVITYEIGGF